MIKIGLITSPSSLKINDFSIKGAILGVEKNLKFSPLPRLWSLALATYLRESLPVVKVDIIDGSLIDFQDIIYRIRNEKFDIIGLSPLVINYKETLKIARFAKKCGAKIVLGGHYATALRREILQNRGPGSDDYCVDAVIQYDGEKAFYEYVAGKPSSKINNLVYRENNQIMENPVEILNLDELPAINYDLVNLNDYFVRQDPRFRRAITFVSQRGCLWAEKSKRCFFCSIQDKKLRLRSPEKVFREIKVLIKKYGIKTIHEVGDDFLGSKEWFGEFSDYFSGIKNKPSFKIEVRPSHIDFKTALAFKKMNIKYVTLGAESFSEQILSRFKKGLTPEINKRAVFLLAEAGLFPMPNIILGGPGENAKTLSETDLAIRTISEKISLTGGECGFSILIFRPDPGSLAWQEFLKKETKYKGKDSFSLIKSMKDWNRDFCKADLKKINLARNRMISFIRRKNRDTLANCSDKLF
ncbi:MAG: radical SAM protein [Candidatus Pacebacteria bacterium]|nr:radical SAM protein [Candidatus Paceibacterota bacterium]